MAKKGTKAATKVATQKAKRIITGRPIKTEQIEIEKLTPADYNPRTITEESMGGLVKSLQRFGLVEPIVVNRRRGKLIIISGHQRIEALKRLKQKKAWCLIGKYSLAEEKLLNITMNNPAIQGDFLIEIADYIRQLQAEIPDTAAFLDLRINEILAELGETLNDPMEPNPQDDVIPEQVPAITKTGDLYRLGEHRLLCADATSAAAGQILMGKEKADLIFTDPPYNVNYKSKAGDMENDDLTGPEYLAFLNKGFKNYQAKLKTGGVFYVAHADQKRTQVQKAIENNGLIIKQNLVWVKNFGVLSRQDYNWQHEPILYGWKPGAGHYFGGDFTLTTVVDDDIDINKLKRPELIQMLTRIKEEMPTTVLKEPRPTISVLHPTMKPISLVARCINASSKPGGLVIDLFMGSGSTLIAAEKLDRRCYGIEIDPHYCDVIVKRWEDYTDKKAERTAAKK